MVLVCPVSVDCSSKLVEDSTDISLLARWFLFFSLCHRIERSGNIARHSVRPRVHLHVCLQILVQSANSRWCTQDKMFLLSIYISLVKLWPQHWLPWYLHFEPVSHIPAGDMVFHSCILFFFLSEESSHGFNNRVFIIIYVQTGPRRRTGSCSFYRKVRDLKPVPLFHSVKILATSKKQVSR